MILTPGSLDFNNIIIYTSTTNQQVYQIIYHGFSNGLSKEMIGAILLKCVPIPILYKGFVELQPQFTDSSHITVTLTDKLGELSPKSKSQRPFVI
jgi:hypothetical protein